MINRCKQVQLDDVAPGMVLSEAVLDARREVLLPAATVLTDTMLRSLERRGIQHVFVVDNDISQEEWDTECRRVQEKLDCLFRRSKGQGASDLLRQYVFEYRTGRAS